MRRLSIISLAALTSLTASACLTEETKCPAGHKRMRGLCVEVDKGNVGGEMDSGTDEPDAADMDDEDAGNDSGPPIPSTACYLDFDRDGAGAGTEVDCSNPYAALPDASIPAPGAELVAVVNRNDDCDDRDPKRAPTLKELCDGMDNNCDGELDDNAKNVCGGTCTRVFDHAPGDACDNAQQGACARPGKYICDGDSDVICNAPQITASSELCGDGIDNDCDGVTDEPNAVNAPLWYQDCDGDGFAASTTGGLQACTKPAKAGNCSWTNVIPNPATRTNWDCNDSSSTYSPTALDYQLPTGGTTSWDFNCDGQLSPDPAPPSTDFQVCNSTMIGRLNAGNTPCESDNRWSNCVVWKAADGTYTSQPTSKCPDSNAHRVSVFLMLANPTLGIPGGWTCKVLEPAPVWPCR